MKNDHEKSSAPALAVDVGSDSSAPADMTDDPQYQAWVESMANDRDNARHVRPASMRYLITCENHCVSVTGPSVRWTLRQWVECCPQNKTVSRDAGADGAPKPLNG